MGKRGGYYLNSLEAEKKRLSQALSLGQTRSERLHRMGSSCAEDHDAAMEVKRRMLAIVEEAICEVRKG